MYNHSNNLFYFIIAGKLIIAPFMLVLVVVVGAIAVVVGKE